MDRESLSSLVKFSTNMKQEGYVATTIEITTTIEIIISIVVENEFQT